MRGPDWPAQRKKALKRDGKKCVLCGTDISTILEVHHIIPFKSCHHNEDWNLITVCTDCHDIIDAGKCALYTYENRKGQEKHYKRLKEAVQIKPLDEQLSYLIKWRKHARNKVSGYKVLTIVRYFRFCLANGYTIHHDWQFKANGNLSIEWTMEHLNGENHD